MKEEHGILRHIKSACNRQTFHGFIHRLRHCAKEIDDKNVHGEEEDEERYVYDEDVYEHLSRAFRLHLLLDVRISSCYVEHASDIACGLARLHDECDHAACHAGPDAVLEFLKRNHQVCAP